MQATVEDDFNLTIDKFVQCIPRPIFFQCRRTYEANGMQTPFEEKNKIYQLHFSISKSFFELFRSVYYNIGQNRAEKVAIHCSNAIQLESSGCC